MGQKSQYGTWSGTNLLHATFWRTITRTQRVGSFLPRVQRLRYSLMSQIFSDLWTLSRAVYTAVQVTGTEK